MDYLLNHDEDPVAWNGANDPIQWAKMVMQDTYKPVPRDPVVLIGQTRLRSQVSPFFQAKHFPHTLLLGSAGSGKTHLARWIASERKEPFEELMDVRPQDMPREGIAFLDEIHRLKRPEWIFPLMETHEVTVVAATTRPEQVEPALRTRFMLRLTLDPLTLAESRELLEFLLEPGKTENIDLLARASAGNPRQATRIATVANVIGPNDEGVLASVEITADGITGDQIRVMKGLLQVARPIGVEQLAVITGMDAQTVKEQEPYLLQLDLIALTQQGRALTARGRKYLAALS